jgi:hypothetical protein
MRFYEVHQDGKVSESEAETIYQARKLVGQGRTLYPSVTTVAKAMTSPILQEWKDKQMLQAAYHHAESAAAGISFEEWRGMVEARMEDLNTAARWGTGLHDCIETGVWGEDYLPWKPLVEQFFAEEVGEIIAQEIPLADNVCRVAGRLDMLYMSKSLGLPCVLDWKSGGWKPKKNPKPTYYQSWPWQLACYAASYSRMWHNGLPRIRSVPVNREAPMLTHRLWTPEEQERAYSEFKTICDIWHRDNLLYTEDEG